MVSWIDGQSSRCTIDKLADLAKELPAAPLDAPKLRQLLLTVLMMKMQSTMAMLPGNDSSLSLLLLLLFTGYFKLSPPLALSQFLMRTQLNN